MPSVLFLALLGLVVVVSASSDTTDDDDSGSTTDTTRTGELSSGFLRARLVEAAKNSLLKVAEVEDPVFSDTSDEEAFLRKKERDERRIARALAAAAVVPATPRESYQAKFTRDTDTLCVTDPIFDQDTDDCRLRAHGPVVFVAKTSASSVISDSFDGDLDGQDDVREAYDNLIAGAGTSSAETLINAFLQAIRNRASVNGGSIDLSALVMTGRRSTGTFATFGPNGDLLFSPCFPVIQDANFNLELYGVADGLNTLYTLTVNYSEFVNAGVDALDISDDTFLDSIGPFDLVAVPFASPDDATLTVTDMVVGEVVFEKCTQYSYFQ